MAVKNTNGTTRKFKMPLFVPRPLRAVIILVTMLEMMDVMINDFYGYAGF
jgi:hypothetical protein